MAVFEEAEIASAVEIQRRSYRLLRWVGDAIERGFIRLERAHQYSTESGAAQAWIAEHFANLPPDCRPPEKTGEEFRRFASFFASYLLTSFDLHEDPGVRLISGCGCYCPICTHLAAAPHLKAKKLRPADKRRAEALKRSYLEELARENSLSFRDELASGILNDPAHSRDAAVATYGAELLRRCRGHSSGTAVLALWRQFAWRQTGSPIRDFELKASAILEAERRLVHALSGTDQRMNRT